MGSIAEGVEFDAIAREWRCKWSEDGDKKSLVEAQKALSGILPVIKSLDGVKSVHRIVCGGNHDFKVQKTTLIREVPQTCRIIICTPPASCTKFLSQIVGNYNSVCWRQV